MGDLSPTRVIAGLGVLVGLLTGLGTVIGWISSESESFIDAFATGLWIAGVVYLLLLTSLCWVYFSALVWSGPGRAALYVIWLVGGSLSLFLVILPYHEIVLRAFGALGLAFVLVFLVVAVRASRREHRESQKVCPDCTETVKKEANVCRYCGYRFGDSYARVRVTRGDITSER